MKREANKKSDQPQICEAQPRESENLGVLNSSEPRIIGPQSVDIVYQFQA